MFWAPMAQITDLYELLGVLRDASDDDIEMAFRKKAKALHPDKGGNADAFAALARAIAVLRDPEKRAHYDRFGNANDRAAQADPAIELVKIEVDGLLGAFLGSDKRAIFYVDVVKVMTDAFDDKIAAIEKQIKTLKVDTVRVADFASRFEADDDDNLIRKMIEYKVRSMTQAMANAERIIETHRAAREIAASHKFRSDPLPPGAVWRPVDIP
jgi:curved DNA-binding protein CbpA